MKKSFSNRRDCGRIARFESLESRDLLTGVFLEPFGPPEYQDFLAQQAASAVLRSSVSFPDPPDLSGVSSESDSNSNYLNLECLSSEIFQPKNLLIDGKVYTSLQSQRPEHLLFDNAGPFNVVSNVMLSSDSPEGSSVSEGMNNIAYANGASGGSGGGDSDVISLAIGRSCVSSVPGVDSENDPFGLLEHRDGTVANSSSSISLENADYLHIVLPNLPDEYYARVRLEGTAVVNSDYSIYFNSNNSNVYQSVSVSNSEFLYSGASGGTTDFYIIPHDNASIQLANKTILLYIDEVGTNASGGGPEPTFDFTNASVSAIIYDDDIEFISQCDYVNGELPTLADNILRTNDIYTGYIFYDPSATTLAQDTIDFLAPINALARNAATLGPITYSIISGNEEGYFSINPSTGIVSLTSAYYQDDITSISNDFSLQIRASWSDGLYGSDEATVNIHRKTTSMTPYTPQTIYIAPMPIPKENWKANNVGVRRNHDSDSGLAQPDSSVSTCYNEDDLIRLNLLLPSQAGLTYQLSCSSNDLKFWKGSDKSGGEYSFTNGVCELYYSCDVWVEYVGQGSSTGDLMLTIKNVYTGSSLYEETMTFRPFESVTCAFVGEYETAGDPFGSPGVNNWVVNQLLNGYDVHVWDDGYDFTGVVDCDENGNGRALDEIANAINNRGVTSVALIGYSHGGGSVYNLSKRLYYDGQSPEPDVSYSNRIFNSYSLNFTSYIDAVRNGSNFSMTSETRRPMASCYHLNQYQRTNVIGLKGDATQNLEFGDENIDRTVLGVVHSELESFGIWGVIDVNETVITYLCLRFQEKMER